MKKRTDPATPPTKVHEVVPSSLQEIALSKFVAERVKKRPDVKSCNHNSTNVDSKHVPLLKHKTQKGRFRRQIFTNDTWRCPICSGKLATNKYRLWKIIAESAVVGAKCVERVDVAHEDYSSFRRQVNRAAQSNRSIRMFPIAQDGGTIACFITNGGKDPIFDGRKIPKSGWRSEVRGAIGNIDFDRTKLRPSESLYDDGVLRRFEDNSEWSIVKDVDSEKIDETLAELEIPVDSGTTIFGGSFVSYHEFFVPEGKRREFFRRIRRDRRTAGKATKLPRGWTEQPEKYPELFEPSAA